MKPLKAILDTIYRDLEWRGPQGRALGHIALERADAQDLLNHVCSLLEALKAHTDLEDARIIDQLAEAHQRWTQSVT